MKREADINRVKRAQEHLQAANTHMNSIKYKNMTRREWDLISEVKLFIVRANVRLNILAEGGEL